jgi:hypothetical protein
MTARDAEIDWSKPFRLPFSPGEKVRHRADGAIGILSSIVVYPRGCMVECAWEPGATHSDWHFAVESVGEDDHHGCPSIWEFPWPWGHKVAHRADGKIGVIDGYRIAERGISCRVTWRVDYWDWHSLCELEEVPAGAGEPKGGQGDEVPASEAAGVGMAEP